MVRTCEIEDVGSYRDASDSSKRRFEKWDAWLVGVPQGQDVALGLSRWWWSCVWLLGRLESGKKMLTEVSKSNRKRV